MYACSLLGPACTSSVASADGAAVAPDGRPLPYNTAMNRRSALKLLGGALMAASAAPAVARAQQVGGAATAPALEPWTVIGFSQGGLPLVVHHVGTGTKRLFIMGGQ